VKLTEEHIKKISIRENLGVKTCQADTEERDYIYLVVSVLLRDANHIQTACFFSPFQFFSFLRRYLKGVILIFEGIFIICY
jgi:hypothetical protein